MRKALAFVHYPKALRNAWTPVKNKSGQLADSREERKWSACRRGHSLRRLLAHLNGTSAVSLPNKAFRRVNKGGHLSDQRIPPNEKNARAFR